MMTKEELVNKLKSIGKKTDEQINEIADKYEKSIENRDTRPTRKNNYKKIKSILGIDDFKSVRFYKIRNVSACVFRDESNDVTKVAFSFYNLNDLGKLCEKYDNDGSDVGPDIWNSNMIPFLYQINPGRNFEDCLHASENLANEKYFISLSGLRASEMAIYEAWTRLSRDSVIPRQYKKWRIEAKIILSRIGDTDMFETDEE